MVEVFEGVGFAVSVQASLDLAKNGELKVQHPPPPPYTPNPSISLTIWSLAILLGVQMFVGTGSLD